MNILSHRAATAVFALITAVPALGDISYSQRITVDAAGGMSMFSSDGEVLTQIAGDRSRAESSVKMKSKLMGMMAGSGTTAAIVRLDRELTWNLLPAEKAYSEITFADARAQMRQASEAIREASDGDDSGALPVSEEACDWSEADLNVEHPEGSEKIAGIKTRKHVIRLNQSCRDPQTGKVCDITWVMETWLAKKVPAEKEVREFERRYSQAMELDELSRQVQGPGQGLLSMFSGNWSEVAEEFAKMEGYPLRTVMQMGLGGEQCTTASGNPIATDEIWANASTAAYNAALDQAGYEAGSAVGRAAGESLGNSVGGSIGGAAIGAAAGELIGGLTGMFKKKKPAQAAPQPEGAAAAQQVTVFRILTEVTNWSEITIPPNRFEVPPGWERR
jgi:hypothetical protein